MRTLPGRGRARCASGSWRPGCRSPMPSCAGTYLGMPKPPFTPRYELVGVVEEPGAVTYHWKQPRSAKIAGGGRLQERRHVVSPLQRREVAFPQSVRPDRR
jgi:hypothetical protein